MPIETLIKNAVQEFNFCTSLRSSLPINTLTLCKVHVNFDVAYPFFLSGTYLVVCLWGPLSFPTPSVFLLRVRGWVSIFINVLSLARTQNGY
jgi:hypothetical protein